MESQYLMLFFVLAVVCAIFVLRSSKESKIIVTSEFKQFQRKFLTVYYVMMAADWLQGPYVYALYKHYGFSIGQIGYLFICGFGSSMVFGTFSGPLADKFGRRMNCLAFGIMYGLCCVTKHFRSYHILMAGRVLGGIATSILFSAFESWMVSEHKKAAYPEEWLSHTFSLMTFGNGIVAILSGLLASFSVSQFGIVAPFDISLAFLVVGSVMVFFSWTENYGNRSVSAGLSFGKGWTAVSSNGKVGLLGITQSCFEAAMYLFVFMWTPKLESTASSEIPHGLIFAIFMVALMIGSNLFSSLIKSSPVELLSRYVFAAAAIFLTIPILTDSHFASLISFCGFEACCGFYFPAMGTMRSKYVPEEVRATVMNIFRIGLNFIVVSMLWHIDKMSNNMVLGCCVFLLLASAVCQQMLGEVTVAGTKEDQKAALSGMEGVNLVSDSGEDVEDGTPDLSAMKDAKD
jgi:MFS family permease